MQSRRRLEVVDDDKAVRRPDDHALRRVIKVDHRVGVDQVAQGCGDRRQQRFAHARHRGRVQDLDHSLHDRADAVPEQKRLLRLPRKPTHAPVRPAPALTQTPALVLIPALTRAPTSPPPSSLPLFAFLPCAR